MANLSRLEQETIINFNEAEEMAVVYTHNAALIRKLNALSDERDGANFVVAHPDGGHEFTIPKKWVKINAGPVLSEEQKRKLSERMKEFRKNQLESRNDGLDSEKEQG